MNFRNPTNKNMYPNVLIVCICLVTSTLLVSFVMWTNEAYDLKKDPKDEMDPRIKSTCGLNGQFNYFGPVDQSVWIA